MNNLYLQDRLVELQMQEVQREVEQARLLREAGLAGEGWLSRAANALRNVLQARKRGSQDQMSIQTKAYPRNKLA
jgi:hypothetical protein